MRLATPPAAVVCLEECTVAGHLNLLDRIVMDHRLQRLYSGLERGLQAAGGRDSWWRAVPCPDASRLRGGRPRRSARRLWPRAGVRGSTGPTRPARADHPVGWR